MNNPAITDMNEQALAPCTMAIRTSGCLLVLLLLFFLLYLLLSSVLVLPCSAGADAALVGESNPPSLGAVCATTCHALPQPSVPSAAPLVSSSSFPSSFLSSSFVFCLLLLFLLPLSCFSLFRLLLLLLLASRLLLSPSLRTRKNLRMKTRLRKTRGMTHP